MQISQLLQHHPAFIYAADMQEITKPLKNIGITYFSHVHFDKNGTMTCNNNSPAFAEHYLKQGYQYHDMHFKYHSNEQHYFLWDSVSLTGKTNEIYQLAHQLNYSHAFSIVQPNGETVDLYHFSTVAGHTHMNAFYLQHIDLLEKYILYYKECLRLHPNLRKAYKLPFGTHTKDTEFQFAHNDENLLLPDINQFLSEINIKTKLKTLKSTSNSLSKREYQCAYLMLDGLTSKEISENLHISPRTVEVYFDRLKHRFNSRNKIQLAKHLMENVFTDR